MSDRRAFLSASLSALASIVLSAPTARANAASQPGFKLSLLQTSWGYAGSFGDYCGRVRDAGYDGIELGWPGEPRYRDEVFNALEKHSLEVGFICIVLRPDGGFERHLDAFTRVMEEATRPGTRRPLYLDCHSGRDYYTFDQNRQFYDRAERAARGTGISVLHETHRSRMLYAPAVARQYIERIPQMRIALDLSHWCIVSESLLEDQAQTVAMALERTDAISARVGHAQGPQVSDPRAPEWSEALQAHLSWWDTVVARKRRRGEALAITTEFGPPDYMPAKPYSKEPLADQWAINVHMMRLLRQRYAG